MGTSRGQSQLISETFLTITLFSLSAIMLLGMALHAVSFDSVEQKSSVASNSDGLDLPQVLLDGADDASQTSAIQTEKQLFAWPSSGDTQFSGEGNVFLDDENRLHLAGGNLQAVDVEQNLLSSCRSSNALSVEVTVVPRIKNGEDYKSILTFHTEGTHHNFRLGQQGSQFVFQLNTTSKTKPTEIRFGKVTPGERHHLLVSYRAGTLICFLNGRSVLKTSAVKGQLENWQQGRLVLGGKERAVDNWYGAFELLGIHSRTMSRNEAFERYDLALAE